MDSLKKSVIFIILIFAFISFQTALAQEEQENKGKIEQFENELEKAKEDTSKNHRAQHDNLEEDNSSFWSNFIGELIVKPVLYYMFIGSPNDEDSFLGINWLNCYFSDYLYQNLNVGLYALPD